MAIMELLWQSAPLSALTLQQALAEQVSLSTVQSTLERLHRKQLLAREKQGRAYVYRPLLLKADLVACLLSDMAADLSDTSGQALVAGFVDYLSVASPQAQGQLSLELQRQQQLKPAEDSAADHNNASE